MNIQTVHFHARDDASIILDGLVFLPEKPKYNTFCVLVHPWGFLGGSRANTYHYAHLLSKEFGLACLIFDTRGVGNSTGGRSFNGSSEVGDVLGACDWVRSTYNQRILLVGSSAGAAIAGSALPHADNVVGYVAIGYTFGWLSSLIFGRHYDAVLKSEHPKLFIMGSQDGFTSVAQLERRIRTMRNAEVRLIGSVGHFMLETPTYASETSGYIAAFLKKI